MKIQPHRKMLLTVTALLLGWVTVLGQQPTDSLNGYLTAAARNNPTVMQRFAEYQASLQKVPQVGSLPDPELSVGVFLKPMEVLSGNQLAEIRFMQMFPWFGVRKNATNEMTLMAKAKYESFRDAKLQVFYDVQRIWYELYKIQQEIRISEKNLDILRTVERLSMVKFKSSPAGGSGVSSIRNTPVASTPTAASPSSGMQVMGAGSPSGAAPKPAASMQGGGMGASSGGGSGLADLYRIQIEIGDLENSIEQLKNQQLATNARFNSLINRPSKTSIVIPDTLTTNLLPVLASAVGDSIQSNNPMLSMLQFERQSLEARKQMVARMGYPMVGFGFAYNVIGKNSMSTSPMNGQDMFMPMVTITLPIYRKRYKAMQVEADLMRTASEQSYIAAANGLQAEYYQAMQLYRDAQRRAKLYTCQTVLANKSLDIMIRSFSASSASLTDILRVRQQLFDYELRQVEALTDYNTSVAWLKRLMAGEAGES